MKCYGVYRECFHISIGNIKLRNKFNGFMIHSIYKTFYDKLPLSIDCIMPVYDRCKIVTCLNAYYMVKLKETDYHWYDEFDYIASDGMGPIKLNKLFGHSKSVRLSFDLSTMALPVFNDMIAHNESLYVLGAKPGEVDKSVATIKRNFKEIKIAGFHHGYIKNCKNEIVKMIISSGAKIVIIGMGAPMQDEMAVSLKQAGFIGTVYTCGGFIHQTQERMVSFPIWTNKLGLRWLYRIFTQSGMLKRLIETYPKFVVSYSWFLMFKIKKANQ